MHMVILCFKPKQPHFQILPFSGVIQQLYFGPSQKKLLKLGICLVQLRKILCLYQQNRLQVRAQSMGLQCAKPIEKQSFCHGDSRQKTFQAQMSKIKEISAFEIKINNLRLINLSKSFRNIKIELAGAFNIIIPFKDFNFQENVLISHTTYLSEFETSIQSLSEKNVVFWMEEKAGRSIQILRIKVHQLFRGPVKHDHLIRQLKARLAFDFHIDQYIHTQFLLENCQIQWQSASHHTNYTYSLNLLFTNVRSPVQTCKVFEKHEKIKELSLNKIKLRNSQLKEAIIKIKIVDNSTSENVLEYFLPISKLHQQNGFKTIMQSQATYELREYQVCKDVSLEDQSMGIVQLQLKYLKSKLYAQQMECVILSEDGIVMHTLTESPSKLQANKKISLNTISGYLERLQLVKENGISEYAFYTLLEQVYIQVQDKHFNITDELFKTQQALLDFLFLISEFLQSEKELQNEYIWQIINRLCKQPILKLKYFCGIKNQQQKIKFAKKFYRFLLSVLKKIIYLTENGLSFKEFSGIHKFYAFAYFRLPWCQEQLVQVLQRKGDPIITEEKLSQIGASYALKSPSKNYFYDWEGSVLRLVRKDDEYLQLMREVNLTKGQSPTWAKLLFDRQYEQLFYSIYSEIWDEAQSFLNNNDKILWEYFPKYGELLAIFFGEANDSKLMDISPQMTKCNMKLIKNQKLLTSFMMLIFPKTHLYETYCVIKCLNLIECYFSVILNDHKMLPYNFHYNYFYTGIKSILQSQHSYLLQKILSIIYKFYSLFSKQFKEDLNKFIQNKVFYKLFLHWSHDVRSIFHMLLVFRILQRENHENPQQSFRKSKNLSQLIQIKMQYEHIISSLVTRKQAIKQKSDIKAETPVKNEFFQRMKLKLSQKGKQNRESVVFTENQEYSENSAMRKCSFMETAPIHNRRKWSVAQESWQFEGVDPTEQELKYLSTSLRQFQMAKKELKPDEKIQMRSKMFQFDSDE